MITFANWQIQADSQILAMQYDNGTCVLSVSGDLPEGWTWEMLVSVGGCLDVLPLSPYEDGFSFLLSAENLSLSGTYALQLRGRQGEDIQMSFTCWCRKASAGMLYGLHSPQNFLKRSSV